MQNDPSVTEALRHAVALEQCSLFVDGVHLAKAMTEAAAFLRSAASLSQPKTGEVGELVAEMRAGLEGVTPGPWFQTGAPWFRSADGVLAGSPDGNIAYIIADCDTYGPREEYEGPFALGDPERDAAHIARCSPDNIAKMLDALEAAQAENAKLTAERDEARNDCARFVEGAVLWEHKCNQAEARLATIEKALERIEQGDVPRPAHKRWRKDGQPSKNDQCKHLVPMYEDCGNCISEFARASLHTGEPT